MARKRMLDPTIWADEDYGAMSDSAMLMFIGIISNADDEGRLPGNALYLASTIFPYKGLSIQKSNAIRNEILSKMKSVILYTVDNKEYIQLKNWSKYQSINKPSDSKYPPLPEDYGSATVGLPPNRIEEKGIEEKGKEEGFSEKNNSAQEFIDYFNLKSGKKYQITNSRKEKLETRLKKYSMAELLRGVDALLKSPFHTGKNDSNTWYADPDFYLRSDEQIDKWINKAGPNILPVQRSTPLADMIS